MEETTVVPDGLLAGVIGTAETQPGVIGWSRSGDGLQGATFTGTAVRAASFFGPGVHSISGALTGVTGISGTQGPQVPDIATTAGVVGTSDAQPGVIGTSNALIGVLGFSNNVGVAGRTTNPNSFAGFFAGNVIVNGTLTANVKNGVVAFPDGTQRVLHCMESPEHWFEDFGTAKLARGRAAVRLDANFAKVVTPGGYRVFVTPEGDCRGLYVRGKSAKRFEVRELQGGKSSVAFSYRIVARRKEIKRHRRFAKIDTRLPVPRAATPRKRRRRRRRRCARSSPAWRRRRGSGDRRARRKPEGHARFQRIWLSYGRRPTRAGALSRGQCSKLQGRPAGDGPLPGLRKYAPEGRIPTAADFSRS